MALNEVAAAAGFCDLFGMRTVMAGDSASAG